MNNDLPTAILDALTNAWANLSGTRDESIAIIRGVVEPVIQDYERRLEIARAALSYPRYGTTADLMQRASNLIEARVEPGWQSYFTPHLLRAAKDCELALAQLGAPSPRDDDEPHPEFIRGYLAAADDLAEPYPADVFAPLTDEQIKEAVAAMGGDISGRLHATWARHWADVLRKRITDGEK